MVFQAFMQGTVLHRLRCPSYVKARVIRRQGARWHGRTTRHIVHARLSCSKRHGRWDRALQITHSVPFISNACWYHGEGVRHEWTCKAKCSVGLDRAHACHANAPLNEERMSEFNETFRMEVGGVRECRVHKVYDPYVYYTHTWRTTQAVMAHKCCIYIHMCVGACNKPYRMCTARTRAFEAGIKRMPSQGMHVTSSIIYCSKHSLLHVTCGSTQDVFMSVQWRRALLFVILRKMKLYRIVGG